GEVDLILSHVVLFFIYALAGFVSSSASSFYSIRSANEAWLRYVQATLGECTKSMQYASENNKRSVTQWLSGEASATLAYACNFYIGLISTTLNIGLSLIVFYISTGWELSLAMAASLGVSIVLVSILRRRIEDTSGTMQARKLQALLAIELTWNSAIFGSRTMRSKGFANLHGKTKAYFTQSNQYAALEQVIACAPIIISTSAVIGLLHYSAIFSVALAGTLVALLPRTLQLLGNVHSISLYMSQFYFIRTKLRNLKNFQHQLEAHVNMDVANFECVSIYDSIARKPISPGELVKQIQSGIITRGRYKVTGGNGAGKSTLLKVLKGAMSDSLLMTPETRFLDLEVSLSTGQTRQKELEALMMNPPPMLMLDEWDANLDEVNFNCIDQKLLKLSDKILVIEVRHSRNRDNDQEEKRVAILKSEG
ncbi:hypothetical protein, partial [Pseudomonas sp. KCJK9000]